MNPSKFQCFALSWQCKATQTNQSKQKTRLINSSPHMPIKLSLIFLLCGRKPSSTKGLKTKPVLPKHPLSRQEKTTPKESAPPPKLAVWSPLRKGTLSSLLSCFTIIYSAHRNLMGFRMLSSIVLPIFPSPWCQRMSQALEANILQAFLWEENPWDNFDSMCCKNRISETKDNCAALNVFNLQMTA